MEVRRSQVELKPTCDGSKFRRKSAFSRLVAAATQKKNKGELNNLPALIMTMWRRAARGQSPFAAARPVGILKPPPQTIPSPGGY